MAALLKRVGIYGVVAVAIAGVTLAAILAFRVYNDHFADTPDKHVRLYLDALNAGDMMKLYDMTRGASGQTQAEFAIMISSLMKDNRLTADPLAVEPIGRQGDVSYFRVMSRLHTSDGSYRLLPLVFETAKEGAVWRVGVYLPPAALPTGQ